jgi:hypothetical protein
VGSFEGTLIRSTTKVALVPGRRQCSLNRLREALLAQGPCDAAAAPAGEVGAAPRSFRGLAERCDVHRGVDVRMVGVSALDEQNRDPFRFCASPWPHAAHVLDVLAAGTTQTLHPASCALSEALEDAVRGCAVR